jgi:hypothetical protein
MGIIEYPGSVEVLEIGLEVKIVPQNRVEGRYATRSQRAERYVAHDGIVDSEGHSNEGRGFANGCFWKIQCTITKVKAMRH